MGTCHKHPAAIMLAKRKKKILSRLTILHLNKAIFNIANKEIFSVTGGTTVAG